jgi:hypothetical protein
MTVTAPAPRTIPPRAQKKTTDAWRVGEIVTISGIRWIIRALNTHTGKVSLSSANTVNADIWWNTTTDKLPRRIA